LSRILPERSGVDRGVHRVIVDVHDRRQIDMHPDRASLGGGDTARLVCQLWVVGGPECHYARERGPTVHPKTDPSFEISRDKQRDGGDGL